MVPGDSRAARGGLALGSSRRPCTRVARVRLLYTPTQSSRYNTAPMLQLDTAALRQRLAELVQATRTLPGFRPQSVGSRANCIIIKYVYLNWNGAKMG